DEDREAVTEINFTRTLQALTHCGKPIRTFQSILNNGLKERQYPNRNDGSMQLNHLQVVHISCGATGLQSLNGFVFRLLKSRQCKVSRAIRKVCKRMHFGACLSP